MPVVSLWFRLGVAAITHYIWKRKNQYSVRMVQDYTTWPLPISKHNKRKAYFMFEDEPTPPFSLWLILVALLSIGGSSIFIIGGSLGWW